MPNAVFGRHPVSSLARRCPSPALACRCRSTPLSCGGVGGRKKRLSRFAQHSCPNHPPPTWHPGGRDRQYYNGADTDAQASVGEGEETPSGPIATSIIRGPPPLPLFGKTTSGILVLVGCRLSDPPCPPQTLLPLLSVQLVLQERPELPRDDHVREGHVAGYRELLDEQSPQRLWLAEEAQSEVIPR
jgi:hypothetical protein